MSNPQAELDLVAALSAADRAGCETADDAIAAYRLAMRSERRLRLLNRRPTVAAAAAAEKAAGQAAAQARRALASAEAALILANEAARRLHELETIPAAIAAEAT